MELHANNRKFFGVVSLALCMLCYGMKVSMAMHIPTYDDASEINPNASFPMGILQLDKYSCGSRQALPCVQKLTGK